MKDTKALYVNRDIRYFNLQNPMKDSFGASDESTNDFGCQFNSRKDNLICTCRRIKRKETGYFSSRQVYRSQRYFNSKDFTDIGVGSVKTLYKNRVKRIYLPDSEDRGVGSSNLSYLHRRKRWVDSYYELKQTSSKCVGGAMEESKISVISKKLSPIIQTISGSTSPTVINIKKNDNTSSFDNKLNAKPCEINKCLIPDTPTRIIEKDIKSNTIVPIKNKTKSTIMSTIDDIKNSSSDSFLQHVHNLENPSYDKQSKTSVDLIKNKLEREYRKIFSTKPNDSITEKPITDYKSSFLRRRFMALRRLGKNEDKNDSIVMKIPSKCSVPSRRDVSIVSDPPSLEARSYSNTKMYSPNQSAANTLKKETQKKEISSNWSTEIVDSYCQDVKGMFKLWGKKFNFEEDNYKKISPENCTFSKTLKKKVELVLPKEEHLDTEKKGGKRFSFFRRKSKDKSKAFKSKKCVTAGRCEVGDGLMIKIGNANEYNHDETTTIKKIGSIPEYDILRKDWFRRYLHNKIDSQNSVQIRWNNSMYTASSSTVFKLIDCVYKNTGIVFKSRSEITTRGSSYYSYRRPQVNFMQQSIEAWMIPTITGDYIQPKNNNRIEVTVSNEKWFIEKSKPFSQKIELVLHSNLQNREISSEYIIIDIPKGYFSDTSNGEKTDITSDELVYNIVEYEMPNSKSYLPKQIKEHKMETGDAKDLYFAKSAINNKDNERKLLEKVIKNPPLHRDVVIQGSDVSFPRRCDVIGVGIITQRDLRDIEQPILKITDEPTDDESKHILPPPKTCELAESFLQDYYRNFSPLGFDVFSWCISDSKLRGSSENNSLKSLNNQGDGSKSCPNVCEDYLASTIVSSCETSSCTHCIALEEERKGDTKTIKFFNKFKNKKSTEPISQADGKRILPKDSLEVFKRRKIYAASNKSKWINECDRPLDKCMQKVGSPNVEKPCMDVRQKTKNCKKHVSLQDCDVMDEILRGQLSDKCLEGILSFKGAAGCDLCKNPPSPQRARVIPDPICEIPQPPCKDSCLKEREPSCSKKNSPTCNVPAPLPCPADPPVPCQKACPPFPPPCRVSPCGKSSCPSLLPSLPKNKPTSCSKSSSQSSPPCSRPKPIPPKVHSPLISPRPSRPCVCPKKQSIPSTPSIPRCHVPKQKTYSSPPPIIPQKSPNCQSCNSGCKSQPSKIEKVCSQEFLWPIKSQVSNTPSKESGLSLKKCPQPNLIKKTSSKCMSAIKRLIQKVSSSSIKDCKPDCANRRKVVPPPPYPPNTTISNTPAHKTKCAPKMTGLHLKKPPMLKCPSKDSLSTVDEGIIRINSREKITIRLRQNTPSTAEIREGCNIKVKDEDGQTLYERRDYKKNDKNRMQFVKDMYRDSQIQRIDTTNPDIVLQENNLKINESSSDTSLPNIIEINFNLKFKQADKTTEVSIKNCGDTSKEEKKQDETFHNESTKEVYVLNDQAKANEETNNTDKKDVSINIMIKNYKIPNKKTNKLVNLKTDDFSKKISEKFQTVSTGYSDIIDQPTYSVHRATVNLSNSDIHKASIKSSIELLNEELKELDSVKFTNSDETVNQPVSNNRSSNIENLLITETGSQIILSKDNIYTTHDEKSSTSISVTDKDVHSETKYINNDIVIPKIRDKEEKKKMLKEIFETASKDKQKNKQQIRQMLRAVLTSDSSAYDIEVNNELVKELTYESLKPNYFKDSDSVTNYLNGTYSVQSNNKEFKQIIYPTEGNNSECSDSDKSENGACVCSKLAEKLKVTENSAGGCCCRRINKRDEEVTCDLKARYVVETKYIDVKTQNSKSISKNESFIPKCEYIEKKETKNRQYSSNLQVKACQIKKLNKRTILYVSDKDKVVLLSTRDCSKTKRIEPLDVLQLYETKKAVLEIYAEKTYSEDGEKIVAKLPKFVGK
ncbi:unnamed protein product, partial [Brenthis ino]